MILLASCWYGRFFRYCLLQGDGAWPPGGGQNSWPHPGELSVWLQWFYSAPLSRTAGCDLGRCGTAKADFIEKPKAFWEALIKSAGCFWFTLLSLYALNSKISLLKLGLFVFSGNMWFNGAGGIQQSFAIPQQDIIFPLWFMQKKQKNKTVHAHHSRPASFCYYLAWYRAEQRREGRGYLANEKQLGQVPDSSQACELNKAHCIDLRVIHYLFWM